MAARIELSDEGGFTLVELLVGILSFVVVFGAITTMITVSVHNQTRISDRVWSNQRARPVMTRIVDALHSGCVARDVAPVKQGSTSSEIRFVSKTGSAVSPTPDLRVITLSGSDLTESIHPATGGSAPTWSFSTTPTSTRTLMTDVSAPPAGVFRYYDYVNGQLRSTPLSAAPPEGLSATDAARTVHVTVSLTVAPSGGVSSQDLRSPITLTDSADLRLESAGALTTQENRPCT